MRGVSPSPSHLFTSAPFLIMMSMRSTNVSRLFRASADCVHSILYESGRISLGISGHFQYLPSFISGFGKLKIIIIFNNYKTIIIKKI